MARRLLWQIERRIGRVVVALAGAACFSLVAAKAGLDSLGKELLAAVQQGNADRTAALLASGYGYEIRVPRGATPLQLASFQHEKPNGHPVVIARSSNCCVRAVRPRCR